MITRADLTGEHGWRALSVSQPWAWCIAHAGKTIENRDWPSYQGHAFVGHVIAIHAAKSFDRDALTFLREQGVAVPMQAELPAGAIVALARYAAIWDAAEAAQRLTAEQVRWAFGPRYLVLEDVTPLARPVPAKGALGFWILTPEQHQAVARQIEPGQVVARG